MAVFEYRVLPCDEFAKLPQREGKKIVAADLVLQAYSPGKTFRQVAQEAVIPGQELVGVKSHPEGPKGRTVYTYYIVTYIDA